MARSPRSPKAKASKNAAAREERAEDIAQRRLIVESLMARRMRTRVIVQDVQKHFAAAGRPVPAERTIYTDMNCIQKLWLEESAGVDRDARRRELRYAMEDTLQRALDAAQVARDFRGEPLIGTDGKPVMVSDPNLGAAARLLDTLAKLDGLYQFPLELKVQENVEKLLDTVKGHMTREAYEQLVRAIAAASGVAGMGAARAGSAGDSPAD